MSTVPPEALRPTVDGFNDETPYDPMLGESWTEERMAHIHSHNHTPTPHGSIASPPSNDSTSIKATEGAQEMADHHYRDSELFEFAHASRVGSGFSMGSLGSLGVGFLDTEHPSALSTLDEDFAQTRFPATDAIISPVDNEPLSRKSSGLATLSANSQFMSPTLTNETLSPTSPRADEPYKLLGGGSEMMRHSSISTGGTANRFAHHTPASKHASSMTSPEPVAAEARLTSPIVRIQHAETHHSPNWTHFSTPSTGKRSRDDQNLLAPDDAFGQDETLYPDDGAAGEPSLQVRSGIGPSARAGEEVPATIEEAAEKRRIGEKNSEITHWLLENDEGPGQYLDPNQTPSGVRGLLSAGSRNRSKSTSKNSQQLRQDVIHSSAGRRAMQDKQTPGPDVLIDEDSGEEDDDDTGSYQESAPASVDGRMAEPQDETHPFGTFSPDEQPAQAFPWVDPIYMPSKSGEQSQPGTSNAAMMRFMQRSRDIETASRAATWGTRRMSDSTLDQVLGNGGLLSRLKLTTSKDKDHEDARSSLQEGIDHVRAKYRQFRHNSVNRRKSIEPIRPVHRTDTYTRGVSPHSSRPAHERKESTTSITQMLRPQRRPSSSRPTTPRLNTGAGIVSATHTIGLGVMPSTSPENTGPASPSHSIHEKFKRFREGLHRYMSDDSEGSGGLADMMRQAGGPPVASVGQLSPPAQTEDDVHSESKTVQLHDEAHDDAATTRGEEEAAKGVKMAMEPRRDLIIPNFDGFKGNVRDVNPRLDEWLVDRLGQEQLRRYKRLVEWKVNHVKAVQSGTCASKEYCAEKGNFKRYFQLPKSAHKDSVGSADAEVPLDALDEDEQAIAEGTVSEAQFPPGLPMPPVERLPAEFECPFCFQVKKFTKPSDWSKHVHEDLQPFTCTFKHCSDPKSFKRKADWVRHENERHRQLEWWECTEEGCQHRCYRRDNFVQHLIREHKLPEPPNKPTKHPNKPAVRGPAKSKGRGRGNTVNIHDVPPEEKVLFMVEACRHETTKNANQEKCRFCGNICSSWKKLTVHLARHMEQLSVPVLELVKVREVNIDTIISPLEPRPPMQVTPSPVEQTPLAEQQQQAFTSPHSGYSVPGVTGGHMAMAAGQMQPGVFAQMHQGYGAEQFSDPSASMYNAWGGHPGQMAAAAYGNAYGAAAAAQFATSGPGAVSYMAHQQQATDPTAGAMYLQDTTGNMAAAAAAAAQQAQYGTQWHHGMGAGTASYGQPQQQHQPQPQQQHAAAGMAYTTTPPPQQVPGQQQQHYYGGWQ